MIFIILPIIGIITLIIIDCLDSWSTIGTKIGAGALGGILGMASALFVTLILVLFTPITTSTFEVTHPIYALTDNIVVEGELRGGLFYTRGYIDGELQYYYLEDKDNRGQQINHVKASHTYLNEISEGEQPTIEFHYNRQTSPDWVKWVVGSWFNYDSDTLDWVRLNVPETTLPDGFTIDMQ